MTRAILVVDVQNDFCPGGSLPVDGGDEVASTINDYLASPAADGYRTVVATMDWHPGADTDPGFAHFAEDPDFVDTWPPHCVAGSEGAELHPNLTLPADSVVVRKGQRAAAYSGFEGYDSNDRSLWQVLRDEEINQVDVVGLATDHCVTATAIDGKALGYVVRVLLPATAGIAADTTDRAVATMRQLGIEMLDRLPSAATATTAISEPGAS